MLLDPKSLNPNAIGLQLRNEYELSYGVFNIRQFHFTKEIVVGLYIKNFLGNKKVYYLPFLYKEQEVVLDIRNIERRWI